MGETLTLILLGFALSLDSFTAGFTFGVRKISVSIKAIGIIGAVTATLFLMAMLIGEQLAEWLSEGTADLIGGTLFIGIGLWVIYQFFRNEHENDKPNSNSKSPIVLKWEIKSLGIVIQILRDPNTADFDSSGDIKGIEALILGAALSLDAFGAGIGAAIFGFVPIFTAAFIALMSSVFLWLGTKSGFVLSRFTWIDKITFLPGVVLIVLGCLKIA